MSLITNILLCLSGRENSVEVDHFGKCDGCGLGGMTVDHCPIIDEVNSWLKQRGHGGFRQLDPYAGGKRVMTWAVYGGAFNHLEEEEFCSFLRGLSWEDPDEAFIFINNENDDKARVMRLSNPGG